MKLKIKHSKIKWFWSFVIAKEKDEFYITRQILIFIILLYRQKYRRMLKFFILYIYYSHIWLHLFLGMMDFVKKAWLKKFDNWVSDFWVFQLPKWGGKISIDSQIFIFGLECLARNKEAWLLHSCILYLVYSQIWFFFFVWMIYSAQKSEIRWFWIFWVAQSEGKFYY